MVCYDNVMISLLCIMVTVQIQNIEITNSDPRMVYYQ